MESHQSMDFILKSLYVESFYNMFLQIELTFCELDEALRLMEERLMDPLVFLIPARPLPSILSVIAMFFLRLKLRPHCQLKLQAILTPLHTDIHTY